MMKETSNNTGLDRVEMFWMMKTSKGSLHYKGHDGSKAMIQLTKVLIDLEISSWNSPHRNKGVNM